MTVDDIPAERREALSKKYIKKLGEEGANKILPKVFELEVQLSDLDEKERNRRIGISVSNSGKKPWNTGRKHSQETLNKIRERTAQAMRRPEIIEKLRAADGALITTKSKPRKPRAKRKVDPEVTAARKAAAEAKKAAKKELEEKKQAALSRLAEGGNRILKQSVVTNSWESVSAGTSSLIRRRMVEDLSLDLFGNSISSQQLEDLETLAEHVVRVHNYNQELDCINDIIKDLSDENSMGIGERALLRGYVDEISEEADEVGRKVRQISSHLPELKDLHSIIRKWLKIHKQAVSANANANDRVNDLVMNNEAEATESDNLLERSNTNIGVDVSRLTSGVEMPKTKVLSYGKREFIETFKTIKEKKSQEEPAQILA
eukprot:CAMPEP_0184497060 /NCGR_PEP_ID=MMETSP0113_2-20130426/35601_1 /TAXON_ID=91329 /ORGANISM="Norrisiella sphaerica, Strain BC52" /LENGTH=374 /DNA_ID=CAMNT_0026884007 /DNA_START=307 /DNA_END=1431 /DNA_ORIENTATION=-